MAFDREYKTELEVIVTNIGTVYKGQHSFEARKVFTEYKKLSQANHGRPSGESVYLCRDGEAVQWFEGKLEREDV
jgi:hypothetical protein